jgi:5-oxoprolinase (ATP-hydrolysing)
MSGGWQFWIDRGGTFTDVVARAPDGALTALKLLSENAEQYDDAALAGIRRILGIAPGRPIPTARIDAIKMGTTVATNALLERTGEPTLLVITTGLGDALRIGTQNRPDLFARHIVLPEPLYTDVLEIEERVNAAGDVVTPLDKETARAGLERAYAGGYRSCAIVFMHGYRFPEHERAVAKVAREAGFTQVSASHEVSPLMKLVPRGDTSVVDAYLTPILRRYIDRVAAELSGARLMFMQSNGGLTDAALFRGKDSILSGPAGGVVGAVGTAAMAGFGKLIGFDMGGTSTDVSHYAGEFERSLDNLVAGVRVQSPMMQIHTVAAGGGSILTFDGARFRVGPESAGADPGPACYRRGGPLTVTDANVLLGRIQPGYFPAVFGPAADRTLDAGIVTEKLAALAAEISAATGETRTPEQVAEGFLTVAVENMAAAIKKISVQRGYDVTEYALACFGGAGGQHACAIADALGMAVVVIHPLAGVLSAYGMGLAEIRALREAAIEQPLAPDAMAGVTAKLDALAADAAGELTEQGVADAAISVLRRVHLRYAGSDTALAIEAGDEAALRTRFGDAHRGRYGFTFDERGLIVEAVAVEAIGAGEPIADAPLPPAPDVEPEPVDTASVWVDGAKTATPVYDRATLAPGHRIIGPAIVIEANATTVVEPGWRAEVTVLGHLVVRRAVPRPKRVAIGTEADPVMLEVFNNLFMSIAEQMGAVLANTASSVNIKERLDFSCAVFDGDGSLIANAPHMPVHLGSMGESVRAVVSVRGGEMNPGDVYALNAPYAGGTHLPDVTVVTPVFGNTDADRGKVLFFVGARGHHADIGGITPGSMPPNSRTVDEEGVLLDNVTVVEKGRFLERELRALFSSGPYPARNPDNNLADLGAQIAACEKGVQELRRMVDHFGLDTVHAYMGHVRDNAAESVRRVLDRLDSGAYRLTMDDGSVIAAAITVDKVARRARIDFTGTSAQRPTNFNAPAAVTRAAVLYVFRCLVDDDIPLNDGCLEPLDIVIPPGSMLDPVYPAAVVAGNVETSQCVTDALFAAAGAMAAAQGTMNNLTFGNARYQYYETICGGTGAGPTFGGADAVHSHMTNSRLTDPEVLEWRFPVLVDAFAIRRGSGGTGKHRGGNGAVRRIKFLEPMTAAILSGRRLTAPFGLAGGGDGLSGRNYVIRGDGTRDDLGPTDETEVAAGDILVIESPGGGAWGTP